MKLQFWIVPTALLLLLGSTGHAGPRYDFDRPQLDSVLSDLRAWLPGEWNSYPQVWYDRHVRMPAEGEHDHWHRTFALIETPHIGDTVFYGQINLGGPAGPILARSQVLYQTFVDEKAGVVTILGQPIADPERFADLHRRPELWPEARLPNRAGPRCRFDWRRDGRQLVGVLDNRTRPTDRPGDGTCTYVAANGQDFLADAEWVLAPDELWLYDINVMGDVQFVGRRDRTHLRLYRAADYGCEISTAERSRAVDAHDRGFLISLASDNKSPPAVMLLRAWYPDQQIGLNDELRLWVMRDGQPADVLATGSPGADITARFAGTDIACRAR